MENEEHLARRGNDSEAFDLHLFQSPDGRKALLSDPQKGRPDAVDGRDVPSGEGHGNEGESGEPEEDPESDWKAKMSATHRMHEGHSLSIFGAARTMKRCSAGSPHASTAASRVIGRRAAGLKEYGARDCGTLRVERGYRRQAMAVPSHHGDGIRRDRKRLDALHQQNRPGADRAAHSPRPSLAPKELRRRPRTPSS